MKIECTYYFIADFNNEGIDARVYIYARVYIDVRVYIDYIFAATIAENVMPI